MRSESIAGVVPLGKDLSCGLARTLAALNVRHAFGVSGGGIGRIWRALLDDHDIRTLHFRHEAGAAFAAAEASLALDCPVAVFCTTGPGITNTLTGLAAARAEGAKVILLSPRTSPAQRGRGAVQETPMPSADFFTPGWLFDDVFALESAEELPAITARLANGFAGVGAYVAHLSIPVSLQNLPITNLPAPRAAHRVGRPFPDPALVDEVVERMTRQRFAIWVGHGARHSSRQVRALTDLTGAPVLATPRGKGIIAEDHRQFLAVTGLGGHPERIPQLQSFEPEFMLVLGTRLGEPSSGWDQQLIPPGGIVHIDIDPSVPGTVFDGPVLAIQAEVGAFLDQVIAKAAGVPHRGFRSFPVPPPAPPPSDSVRPQALMAAIQQIAVDAGLPVLVEPGSAMAWAANQLVMRRPGQLRIVGGFGSMGQMACGVIGTALAKGGPAICLTGDGSMLMNNEISTAVEYGVPAIWVVLNNARYQMCEKGMRFGPTEQHARFRRCDFVQVARGMGARAVAVAAEADLVPALRRALDAGGPYLVDIEVDPDIAAPFESRFKTLAR